MADEDDDSGIRDWLRRANRGHGYADVFASGNRCKQTTERLTIDSWSEAVQAEYGVAIENISANPTDPPDFHVSISGQSYGVELVQMVDEKIKKLIATAVGKAKNCREAKGEPPPKDGIEKDVPSILHDPLFERMQWTKEKLVLKLQDVIDLKAENYAKNGQTVDILVVHTDEPWLTSRDAFTWLKGVTFNVPPCIGSVSLLFFYEPGRDVDHWPVCMVHGELPR